MSFLRCTRSNAVDKLISDVSAAEDDGLILPGGTVNAVNLAGNGARVSVVWPRGVIDGESPPVARQED